MARESLKLKGSLAKIEADLEETARCLGLQVSQQCRISCLSAVLNFRCDSSEGFRASLYFQMGQELSVSG